MKCDKEDCGNCYTNSSYFDITRLNCSHKNCWTYNDLPKTHKETESQRLMDKRFEENGWIVESAGTIYSKPVKSYESGKKRWQPDAKRSRCYNIDLIGSIILLVVLSFIIFGNLFR